jgi:HCNGP-like protein
MATPNGLVGYDSSSDEDEEKGDGGRGGGAPATASEAGSTSEAPRSMANVTAGRSVTDDRGATAPQDAVCEVAAIGPLLGPDAPRNGGMVVGEAPSPAERPEKMSERETIRYLTQPPVPMNTMPPSPPGSPDPAANARFARFLDLKAKGVHFNEDLAQKSSFLNQGLLATMMARAGVNEEEQYNTSLPLDIWCPTGFPEWAYKERLLESQQQIRDRDEAEKKILSAAGTRTIDFAPLGESSGDSSRRATPSYQKRRRRP